MNHTSLLKKYELVDEEPTSSRIDAPNEEKLVELMLDKMNEMNLQQSEAESHLKVNDEHSKAYTTDLER